MSLIEIKNLSLGYEKNIVLKNLNFMCSKIFLEGSFTGSWETSTAVSRALNRITLV